MSAAWAGHHGPINMRLSFPRPLLERSGYVESAGDYLKLIECSFVR